jgi:hypothetical protein
MKKNTGGKDSLAKQADQLRQDDLANRRERSSLLELFGHRLAKREGYREHKGMDALHFFLIQKYHWLPSQVRPLSLDDLEFLFEEERAAERNSMPLSTIMKKEHPEPTEKLLRRMADKLVEYGYAERHLVDDRTSKGKITWTQTGTVLKNEIQRVHDTIVKDRGELGKREALTMLILFVNTR